MFKKFKAVVDNLEGDIAEVGVYQGRSALRLAQTFPNKTIRLFDTFCGMPVSDLSIDSHKEGDFADTTLAMVQEKLKRYENIQYYPGLFPVTTLLLNHLQFAFVNIDVDLYRSTRDCIAFFWPRLVKGGIFFVQDDYRATTCKGVKKAVDELTHSQHLGLKEENPSAWIVK